MIVSGLMVWMYLVFGASRWVVVGIGIHRVSLKFGCFGNFLVSGCVFEIWFSFDFCLCGLSFGVWVFVAWDFLGWAFDLVFDCFVLFRLMFGGFDGLCLGLSWLAGLWGWMVCIWSCFWLFMLGCSLVFGFILMLGLPVWVFWLLCLIWYKWNLIDLFVEFSLFWGDFLGFWV